MLIEEPLNVTRVGDRVVCAYFPPYILITTEVLERESDYLHIMGLPYPKDSMISSNGNGYLKPTSQLQIKVNNGGAIYWLADADEHGIREGVLDRLIPGLDAEQEQ